MLCLDDFSTGSPTNVAHLTEVGPFRLIRADVTDFVHVVGDVDAVLHFASPASPIDYLRMPIETLKVGSTGTLHTLGLAKEKRAADRGRRRQPDPIDPVRRRSGGGMPAAAAVDARRPGQHRNPHEVSIIELALLIRDLVGSFSTVRYVPRPEDDPTVRQPDIMLARRSLGWEPTVDLADGLRGRSSGSRQP